MIDWFVAEKIGAFVAGTGEPGTPNVELSALAADAEARVVAYTGLQPARALPPPEGISRREWVASNLASMRMLLDPVLERAGRGLGPVRPAVQLAIGLTLTTEVGVVIGYLAQRVLGQYEVVLLEEAETPRPPRLLFVLPNLSHAIGAFGADEREFTTWVALHEVTHAVQFSSVTWLQPYLAGLVRELLRNAEVRIDTRRRLRLPTRQGLRRTADALRRGDLNALMTNDAERETLDRVQAVMAVIEGHAEHVMDAVAPELLPSLPRLRAAIDRRRRQGSLASRLIARLLGLEMKLRQYERGKRFCDAVVDQGGTEALARVFADPGALPTLAEIEAPEAWLARTAPPALSASAERGL
jgi:coenzyme F420 biosynthesis associated uncharacterized protein